VTGGDPLGSRASLSEVSRRSGCTANVSTTGASPREVTCSLDASPTPPVARHGFRTPPSPQDSPTTFQQSAIRTRRSVPTALGVFPASPSARSRGQFVLRVHAPFRVSPQRPPCASRGDSTGLERARGLPGFLPLQHIRIEAFTYVARACLTRLRSAFRVSYPPDGFPRFVPSRLVSSRKRSWGCALQSLSPSEEPFRLSTLAALLTFPSPARLASA